MPPIQLDKITNAVKLRNAKSKRSKNLIKKCMELSQLCGLKVNLVIFDEENNRIQEYNSHKEFDLQKMVSIKHDMRKRGRKELQVKSFSNQDMQIFIKNEDGHSSHHDFEEEQQEFHSDRTRTDKTTDEKIVDT